MSFLNGADHLASDLLLEAYCCCVDTMLFLYSFPFKPDAGPCFYLLMLSLLSSEREQLRGGAAVPDGLWNQRAQNHPAVSRCHPETHVP